MNRIHVLRGCLENGDFFSVPQTASSSGILWYVSIPYFGAKTFWNLGFFKITLLFHKFVSSYNYCWWMFYNISLKTAAANKTKPNTSEVVTSGRCLNVRWWTRAEDYVGVNLQGHGDVYLQLCWHCPVFFFSQRIIEIHNLQLIFFSILGNTSYQNIIRILINTSLVTTKIDHLFIWPFVS